MATLLQRHRVLLRASHLSPAISAYFNRFSSLVIRKDGDHSHTSQPLRKFGCGIQCFSSHTQGAMALSEIKHADLQIVNTTAPKMKPDDDALVFGQSISDHMLILEWDIDEGWKKPVIKPHENLLLDPSASVFHYGSEIYEGLKAYRGADRKIRLFRPMENLKRFWNSARRMALPTFDKEELYKCLVELVRLDQDWVPYSQSCSLYIRPTLIGTEPSLGVKTPSSAMLFVITCPVGPYFKSGTFNPVSLLADEKYIRSWPGGVGEVKAGGNYGATVYIQGQAEKQGCNQVLWLFNDQVTEVGTMNLFMYWINDSGVEELITPPLDGLTLAGITRKSILELARSWGEFKVSERMFTMKDLSIAAKEGRIKEIFGSGTACMVCPVDRILYKGEQLHIPTMENGPDLTKRFYQELNDIQYGRQEHEWTEIIS
ncbi:branched-chain-amino-acid aminotransferase, cytosolic-like [Rhopilema esculentum]|uniref:branched-chain-amino-acid aminotransferase, cytosolic-like n=1 Tax=Rhopilema esculentum TaxID=499914 RepID=UPI0031D1129E|eukprot:gene11263-21454_t